MEGPPSEPVSMPGAMSIRRRLIAWLLSGLLLAIVVAAVGTFFRARDEANVLFDSQLREMAASLTEAPFSREAKPAIGEFGGPGALVVQIWDRNGSRLFLSQPQRDLPQNARLGFTTLSMPSGEWRVFSLLSGAQVVQVAQPMRVRQELAAGMALRTIFPLILIVPPLVLLIWYTIARGLLPLKQVAAAVAQRSPESLEPIKETNSPEEVQPLIHALNGLLGRLERALGAQRHFIADAAHELRTPLAAVHLQAQLAERATTPEERSKAMDALKAGLARASHLVDQLLALARADPGVVAQPMTSVDLAAITTEVVAEYAPLATAKAVDLGMHPAPQGGSARIIGNADALRRLVSNLVDNAVRYTPAHGRIDVGVQRQGQHITLTVRDNGAGVPDVERHRLFDRFFRGSNVSETTHTVAGSGLGLAIVKSIAERHHAEITLGQGLDGRGFSISVRFRAEDGPADSGSYQPS